MDNFKDITIRVLEAHAGFQVETPHEAEQIIRELLTRPEYYDHIVRNGQKLMAENRGTTRQIVQTLSSALGGRQG
jgi:3-deoxy-D-manno-octulosonic-acid transferase